MVNNVSGVESDLTFKAIDDAMVVINDYLDSGSDGWLASKECKSLHRQFDRARDNLYLEVKTDRE